MPEPTPTSPFPTDDAPQEIEPGLWRIPLPLPYELRSVNVYLVDEGPGARILIDSGFGLAADEAALRAGLAQAGVSLADVTTLVLTHAHPDHIGLSGVVAAESGAPILMLAGEEQRLRTVWGDPDGVAFAHISALLLRHGLPAALAPGIEEGTRRMRRVLRLAPAHAISTVAEDDVLTLGRHQYRVLWTPGHSDRHLCLLRDDGLLFVGDHILPHITPNIGFYPDSLPDPLGSYLDALASIAALPARLALPGHGRPFAEVAGRANAIARHHEERSAQVRAVLATAHTGLRAAEVAKGLFGARLRSQDDWRFALLETLAHLEYLRVRALVDCATPDNSPRYALSDVPSRSATR